jgi:hypothetical protein
MCMTKFTMFVLKDGGWAELASWSWYSSVNKMGWIACASKEIRARFQDVGVAERGQIRWYA